MSNVSPTIFARALIPVSSANGVVSLQWQWINVGGGIPETEIGGTQEVMIPAVFDILTDTNL